MSNETQMYNNNTSEPKVINTSYNKENKVLKQTKVVLVGVGQGGTNVATTIASKLNDKHCVVMSINTSKQDLDSAVKKGVPENNIIKMNGVIKMEDGSIQLDTDINGTGKDRSISSLAARNETVVFGDVKATPARVLDIKLESHLGPETYVCFIYTAGGGSGSGGGLPIGLEYQNIINNKVKYTDALGQTIDLTIKPQHKPVIKHIVVLPSTSSISESGDLPLANTSSLLAEIQKAISANAMSVMLFDNGSERYNLIVDANERFNKINDDIAVVVSRAFGISSSHGDQCMDSADRKASAMVPGLTTCMLLDDDNQPIINSVIPDGNKLYTRSTIEYPVHTENVDMVMKKLTKDFSFNTNMFHPYGIGDESESILRENTYENKPINDYGFATLNGLKNIKSVIEYYINAYNTFKAKSDSHLNVNKELNVIDKVEINENLNRAKSDRIKNDIDLNSIFDD